MTKEEQKRFVTDLVNNIEAELIKRISDVPEEWDIDELRQWISDRFAAEGGMLRQDRRRYRAYKSEVLVRNLIQASSQA